ncbi:MAG: histidine kinase [Saprospiraceae bacterium]|nr:histidine kinase [Saprospiraceae bacterium]
MVEHSLRESVYNLITKRAFYHTLFWLCIGAGIYYLYNEGSPVDQGALLTGINLVFLALLVYFNLLYLIPNYLTKKKFLTYIGLLVLSALIISPLRDITFFFVFIDDPVAQSAVVHLENQLLTFVGMLGISSSSTLLKITTEWLRDQRNVQVLETQTMQSELNFLKSQINPHFLFNTLNNLYALTLKKSEKAPEIVVKLSEMMRYMLYECNERNVPLEKEVNYLKNYLDLEKLRQGDDARISFQIHGEVTNQQIAPLLFIPFLENSFKHGLTNTIHEGYVNILLDVEEDHVRFEIENSKPETLPAETHKKSGCIGLKNVRRRLNLLYPDQYDLILKDTPRSYSIALDLDLY